MFEILWNVLAVLAVVTVILLLLTWPGWCAGVILAHRVQMLPVPALLRRKVVQWAVWYVSGFVLLGSVAIIATPESYPSGARVAAAVIAVCCLAMCVADAVLIGWTGSVRRQVRWASRRAKQQGVAMCSPRSSTLAGVNSTERPGR